MKKLLGILVLGLILFVTPTNISFAIEGGYGELKLSNKVLDVFVKYIKGRHTKAPYIFAVALDGSEYQYWYCPAGLNNCRGGSPKAVIKDCEKYSRKYGSGAKCAVFAHNRTIKWNNGINKRAKINSKWSDEEIRAKLTELGFLGGEITGDESSKSADIKFPEALKPFNQGKKDLWIEYMSYTNHTAWPYSAWFEVRSKNGAWRMGWAADRTLKLALKKAKNTCEKSRKKNKKDFTNSEICIVYAINGVETTNEEKIKYAEKFYKKIASESLEKNSWILSSKSDFKDTTENKNKGNTVEQLQTLTKLYESGNLTKEEFDAAKKKISK